MSDGTRRIMLKKTHLSVRWQDVARPSSGLIFFIGIRNDSMRTLSSNEPGRDTPQQSPEGSPEPASIAILASIPALASPIMEVTSNPPTTSYYQPVSPMLETVPFTRYNHASFRTPRTPQNLSSSSSLIPRSSPHTTSSPK